MSEKPGADNGATGIEGLYTKFNTMTRTARAVWFTAAGLLVFMAFWGFKHWRIQLTQPASYSQEQNSSEEITLPEYNLPDVIRPVNRQAVFDTVIPNRQRVEVIEHTVVHGDSVFSIATQYHISPESLLWANYDQLNDNPDMLAPDMVLNIPPVDGVYYQWQEGDSLASVSRELKANAQDILDWPGNQIDLVSEQINPGQWLMVPGGEREFRSWVIPTINRGHAGVSTNLYGSGTCEGGYDGALGTGTFGWPSPIHELVGNDYWSGHLAIDIVSSEGIEVMAADSGVVVFAGWATGGYGYMVMIDHGNGYSTVYAHLSQVVVYCGNSVTKGQTIGYGGSSGNSTGPHLHFELRYENGFTNPWYILP